METMPAGRELDALVAEKVFNYAIRKEWVHSADEPDRIWYRPPGSDLFAADLPRYSTDIAVAWRVVEKIKAIPRPQVTYKGAYVRVAVTESASGAACDVQLWGKTCQAKAPTAPHAICLAALKVVGA